MESDMKESAAISSTASSEVSSPAQSPTSSEAKGALPPSQPVHGQRALNELNAQYNCIFQEKEELNRKRREVTSTIRAHIAAVQSHKRARTEMNKKVRELKQRREELHTKIKTLIQEVTVFAKQRDEARKKSRDTDPGQLQRELKHLETRLETEALPFAKEKELSKKINELRKKCIENAAVTAVFENYAKKNNELRDSKRDAQTVHEEIQKLAKESEHHHQEIIALSKKVDELKIHEEEFAQKFKERMNECIQLEQALKQALGAAAVERAKVKVERQKQRELKEQKQKEDISRKKEHVEEKLRQGKTLTNDDILVMQASDSDEVSNTRK